MSNTKNKVYEKIVTILDKFSDRLVRVASQGKENANNIVALDSRVKTVADRIDEVRFKNDKREEAQTLRDQNNVQSLVNLRESTQKGFDQVRKDVEQLLNLNQRLNERVGQTESLVGIGNAAFQHMTGIENRVSELEKSSLPSDHVWVNKKLTGVYDSIEEVEKRIAELESEMALVTALRKAQAAYVEAQAAFNSGLARS
jgi:hypothetical protein